MMLKSSHTSDITNMGQINLFFESLMMLEWSHTTDITNMGQCNIMNHSIITK